MSRPTFLSAVILAVVLAAVGAIAATAPATSASAAVSSITDLDTARQYILAETNEARAAAALPPLTLSASLTVVAQSCSDLQARNRLMAHCLGYFDKYAHGWQAAAENVAYGFTYESVVNGWMDSPGHRANILSASTHIGIGVSFGQNGSPYFTEDFAEYTNTADLDRRDALSAPALSAPLVSTPAVSAPAVSAPVPSAPAATSEAPKGAPKVFTGVVKVTGIPRVGETLTARGYHYPAGTRFHYRWLSGGKPIRGGTSATLKVTGALEGKALRVVVSAARSGYGATRQSAGISHAVRHR